MNTQPDEIYDISKIKLNELRNIKTKITKIIGDLKNTREILKSNVSKYKDIQQNLTKSLIIIN